ncbi:MAG: sigma-54-dependent transcriptional regulator [Nitrospinales bacterium]
MSNILVVDDEKSMCDFLSIMLEKDGYGVKVAQNGISAAKLIKENDFDVVITDVQMPQSNGLDVLDAVNKTRPNTPVVMMTAYATAETAVEAMKKGAYDYISKPFNIEDLQLIIKNAVEKKSLSDENTYLKSELSNKHQFSDIVGKSQKMLKLFDYISKVSSSNATILITGESGTGKELVAKAIHYNGPRRNHKFISINCGAMPENLLESELFGHEKGAFTSADSTKIGLLETADKGTFFFDEVYEAPLTTQVKLLRVLQEREFTRVGGTKTIKVDLRVIAATNRDLAEGVQNKTFRQDLFYRLNVIPIHLPPLRERTEDIPQLVTHFINKFNSEHKQENKKIGIDPEAIALLEKFNWPGNVRELENAVERAVVLETTDKIHPESLPDEVINHANQPNKTSSFKGGDQPIDLEKTLDQIEKDILTEALGYTNGVINKAADRLNLSFRSMRYRVKKHQLKAKSEPEE